VVISHNTKSNKRNFVELKGSSNS